MNPTPRHVRRGTMLFAAVIAISICGYRWFGRSWLDATYMVVITLSTIGYGETSNLPPGEQVFTMLVVMFGLTASAYTLGGFFQMLTQGEIEKSLGTRRMRREISELNQHVIVCGFGRMGRILCAELRRREVGFVVVDRGPASIAEIKELGYLGYQGDATEEETLRAVGIERAQHLVTVLPGDAENVYITLTSRNLNPDFQIIARGEIPSTQKKLLQAGATRVILPAAIGGLRAAAMITEPSTIELMELFMGNNVMDVEIDQLKLGDGCPLVGRMVSETMVQRRHGLLVVAVKRADGQMVFNPDDDFSFLAQDSIVVMGKPLDIKRFCEENKL
jgi:voltage-gated potassium channel